MSTEDDQKNSLDSLERRRRRGGRPKLFSLSAAVHRHLEELKERSDRPSTHKQVRSKANKLLDGLGHKCLLATLGIDEVKAHLGRRRETCKDHTLNLEISLLIVLIKTAVERGDIAPTPLLQQLPKLRKKTKRVDPDTLAADEVSHLICVANNGLQSPAVYTRTALILAIGNETGMRHDEVMHIQKANIDFNANVIRVRNIKEVNWKTKSGNERTVPMTEMLVSLLRSYLSAQADASPWLFPGGVPGKPLTATYSAELIAKIFKQAGFDGRRLPGMHMLRRTWGTAMAEVAPIDVLRSIGGWEKLDTVQAYVTSNNTAKQAAVKKFERAREAALKPSGPSSAVETLRADIEAVMSEFGVTKAEAVALLKKR